MELIDNLAHGFSVALSLSNLGYCLVGVFIGTVVGVLPGIGALATVAMLLPLTFGLDPIGSLIMLAGIYYGAVFGSSTTAILMNLPGTPATAVVCLDGYPLAKKGRAGAALCVAAIASFAGGCIATFFLALVAPPLARIALQFQAAEYFSLMILGLLAAAVLTRGSTLKGVGMVLVGLALGLVGTDVNSGIKRFDLGIAELSDGISIVVLAMAMFGLTEVIVNLDRGNTDPLGVKRVRWRELVPTREELGRSVRPIFRGIGVGSFMGILPGAGPTISSFMAYALEKRISRRRRLFGSGMIEGVAAPESANNASVQTAFIPTFTLGIPGDVVMALMLGAMMIQGIVPGPQVMTDYPDLFWGLIASMVLGNFILLILNLPLVGIWVKLLTIPYRYLFPSIIMLVCIGMFSLHNNPFDVYTLAVLGVVGYAFHRMDLEPAPMLLGLILGPMMEEHFRRALLLSRGDPAIFVERPISLVILLMVLLLIASTLLPYLLPRQFKRRRQEPVDDTL